MLGLCETIYQLAYSVQWYVHVLSIEGGFEENIRFLV